MVKTYHIKYPTQSEIGCRGPSFIAASFTWDGWARQCRETCPMGAWLDLVESNRGFSTDQFLDCASADPQQQQEPNHAPWISTVCRTQRGANFPCEGRAREGPKHFKRAHFILPQRRKPDLRCACKL